MWFTPAFIVDSWISTIFATGEAGLHDLGVGVLENVT
jgi:hypothetical protein